jgi:putative cell wall-binding protein
MGLIGERADRRSKTEVPLLSAVVLGLFLLLLLPPAVWGENAAIILPASGDWRLAYLANGYAVSNNFSLFLNEGPGLSPELEKELEPYRKVILFGGEESLPPTIEERLSYLKDHSPAHQGLQYQRITGADIGEVTATVIRRWVYARHFVVVRGDLFPDALLGSSVSGVLDAPLIYTVNGRIPRASLEAMLDRKAHTYDREGVQVIILGGPEAVSPEVEDSLRSLGFVVERIGGADRFETSALVAEHFLDRYRLDTTPIRVLFTFAYDPANTHLLGLQSSVERAPILFYASLSPPVTGFMAQHPEITEVFINVPPGVRLPALIEEVIEPLPQVKRVSLFPPPDVTEEEVVDVRLYLEAKGIDHRIQPPRLTVTLISMDLSARFQDWTVRAAQAAAAAEAARRSDTPLPSTVPPGNFGP